MFDNGTREIAAGTAVRITGHKSNPGQGLNYVSQIVTLSEPCETYGWDVIDCISECGTEMSVYSFSVADFVCESCDDKGCGFCQPSEPWNG